MNRARLEHLGISVTDIESAIGWYRDVFGLEVVKRFEKPGLQIKGAAMMKGDLYIEILEPYEVNKSFAADDTLVGLLRKIGANHFAVTVEDPESFYRELKSKGVDLVTEIMDRRFFFCRDPDGTLIEIRGR